MATVTGISTRMTNSAGQWTFYKRLGKTVAREKMEKRPNQQRSRTQVEHTIRMNNLVAFWAHTKGCLSGSFVWKRQGLTDYNAFVSENYNRNRICLSRGMTKLGACVAGPYILSRGYLEPIEVSLSAEGVLYTDIALGEGFEITPQTTVRDLSIAIVDHNQELGFRFGDVIMIVAVKQKTESSDGCPRMLFRSRVLHLDVYNTDPLSFAPDDPTALAVVNGCLGATAPIVGGRAWIHASRTKRGTDVSTQKLVLSGEPDAPYSTPEAREAAIASYRPKE